jgi:NADPH:quinone reductase-like Zn-dependent oxidoreductase
VNQVFIFAGYGLVESLGSGVTDATAGQRVVCIPSREWSALDGVGTWQQYLKVPRGNLLCIPDSISDQAAAQFAVRIPGDLSSRCH